MSRARDLVLLGLFAAALVRADTNVPVPTDAASGITIKLTSPVTSLPRFGFVPMRVTIENLSARDGVWKFRFNAGTPGAVLGVSTSAFELAVPAAQTRESWIYVPLAEPGLSPNPSAAALPNVTSGSSGFAAPPTIEGVYPRSPPGVPPPTITRQATSVSPSGSIVRTFTISQTGPAAKLPPIPAAKLPANATVSITPPNAAGEVTRITTVPVDITQPAMATRSSAASMASSQSMSALSNARAKLSGAGLDPTALAGVTTRSSTRSSTTANGIYEITVTILQTGPASELTLPDLKKLPTGFTSVTVNPTSIPNEVVREFTYVEKSLLGSPTSLGGVVTSGTLRISGVSSGGGGGGFGGTTSSTFTSSGSTYVSPTVFEAEARRTLGPTGLLVVPPGVSTNVQTRPMPMSNPGGGISGSTPAISVFEQTGPTSSVRLPATAGLPPTVKVTLHPTSTPGISVRVISVVDPAVLATLRANVLSGTTSSSIDKQSLSRIELMRLGYLRTDSKISQSFTTRSANAGGSSGSPSLADLFVHTESGPANLLPEPPAGTLPPGITCRITPGLMPGEVSRNFLVNLSLVAGAAPTSGASGWTTGTVPLPRAVAAAMNAAPTLGVDVSGPGLAQGHLNFPNLGSSPLPPMAIGSGLEATVRAKLVAASLRSLPNFASVDPATLPADWRVWSSFNSVLLKADDFAALDAGRRAALRGWVALGGVLYLTPAVSGESQLERIGAGRIETFENPIGDVAPRDVVANLQLATLSPGLPNRDVLRFAPGSAMADMVKFEGADVVWLTIFLIVFAVVVGPVNVLFFAPAAKRHRLFWTTPVISVIGAMAVAGAIVFQDGFGGNGVRRALVVLLPGENQAAVFQEQAAHTGFLSKRDFALDEAILCAALPTDELAYVLPNPAMQFVRAAGQASGEWFRNRSRQAHLLRQLAPTRARVEVVDRTDGGAPIVESTLATELHDFRVRDDHDNYWYAEAVGPGRRVTLRAETATAAEAALREFGGDGTPAFTTVLGAATLQSAWQWSARGGNTDLAPIRTLGAIRWKDQPVTYTGVAERVASGARPKAAGGATPATAPTDKGGQ
jgi:hypothetical protein